MPQEITPQSTYSDRLTRIIPAELIAAFIAIDGITSVDPEARPLALWVSTIALTLAVPFYLWFVHQVRNAIQLIISAFSFVVWVFSIGGPFLTDVTLWYRPVWGSVALILWTTVVPIFPLVWMRDEN